MSNKHALAGVYAAAVTPLRENLTPDYESIVLFLEFLAQRGCHGALLLGTTGEGPSFGIEERLAILREALKVRQRIPNFRLLAGCGTPSLEDTVHLCKAAFDLGMDGVVVLPPYFFKEVSDEGLFAWYSRLIERAVPAGGAFFAYHIPPLTKIPISSVLLSRLLETYPDRFAGLKDSSGEAEQARRLGEQFGNDLLVMNGNDRLFSMVMQYGASGCITAPANILSTYLRKVWDAHINGTIDIEASATLQATRQVIDKHSPVMPLLKGLLARRYGFPKWAVKPPLAPMAENLIEQVSNELDRLCDA